jgi:hypothetical protein
MAAKISFTIQEPKKIVSSTSIQPGMFNDDLIFVFHAKDFHTTDSKEVASVFADLDRAVQKVKETWNGAANAS